jgi:hypothetical protein
MYNDSVSITPVRCAALVVVLALFAVTDTALAQKRGRSSENVRVADWNQVEEALGRKGTSNPGGVMKFSFPRSDLQVVLNGVTLKPALALGSWVAFKRIADHVMVMGDLVLLESEVASVMGSLQLNGVEQTALHNHLQGESPRVMYMHISAIGNAGRIARAVRTALGFTGTPVGPPIAASAAPINLDTAGVANALGVRGKVNGGVYQVSVPRREKIQEDKQEILPSMGVATAINFQPTLTGQAVVTGDFVLLAREVNPVLWILGENGIAVTAIHSHMINEQPRLFFMHFWGNDDALRLARGLRAALDRVGSKR